MLHNALQFSHALLRQFIKNGDTVIDATMGNGNDTLLLSELVGKEGYVYSFDIQEAALLATEQKLKQQARFNNTKLILDCHSHTERYVHSPISSAIFNLGYLPKGDHHITTTFSTTQLAIQQMLNLLLPKGIIILVLYSGHDNGAEAQAILNFTQQLDQQFYNVLHYHFINQRNCPPQVIVIEKKEVKHETKY